MSIASDGVPQAQWRKEEGGKRAPGRILEPARQSGPTNALDLGHREGAFSEVANGVEAGHWQQLLRWLAVLFAGSPHQSIEHRFDMGKIPDCPASSVISGCRTTDICPRLPTLSISEHNQCRLGFHTLDTGPGQGFFSQGPVKGGGGWMTARYNNKKKLFFEVKTKKEEG